jgi:hypothetical protein
MFLQVALSRFVPASGTSLGQSHKSGNQPREHSGRAGQPVSAQPEPDLAIFAEERNIYLRSSISQRVQISQGTGIDE